MARGQRKDENCGRDDGIIDVREELDRRLELVDQRINSVEGWMDEAKASVSNMTQLFERSVQLQGDLLGNQEQENSSAAATLASLQELVERAVTIDEVLTRHRTEQSQSDEEALDDVKSREEPRHRNVPRRGTLSISDRTVADEALSRYRTGQSKSLEDALDDVNTRLQADIVLVRELHDRDFTKLQKFQQELRAELGKDVRETFAEVARASHQEVAQEDAVIAATVARLHELVERAVTLKDGTLCGCVDEALSRYRTGQSQRLEGLLDDMNKRLQADILLVREKHDRDFMKLESLLQQVGKDFRDSYQELNRDIQELAAHVKSLHHTAVAAPDFRRMQEDSTSDALRTRMQRIEHKVVQVDTTLVRQQSIERQRSPVASSSTFVVPASPVRLPSQTGTSSPAWVLRPHTAGRSDASPSHACSVSQCCSVPVLAPGSLRSTTGQVGSLQAPASARKSGILTARLGPDPSSSVARMQSCGALRDRRMMPGSSSVGWPMRGPNDSSVQGGTAGVLQQFPMTPARNLRMLSPTDSARVLPSPPEGIAAAGAVQSQSARKATIPL